MVFRCTKTTTALLEKIWTFFKYYFCDYYCILNFHCWKIEGKKIKKCLIIKFFNSASNTIVHPIGLDGIGSQWLEKGGWIMAAFTVKFVIPAKDLHSSIFSDVATEPTAFKEILSQNRRMWLFYKLPYSTYSTQYTCNYNAGTVHCQLFWKVAGSCEFEVLRYRCRNVTNTNNKYQIHTLWNICVSSNTLTYLT